MSLDILYQKLTVPQIQGNYPALSLAAAVVVSHDISASLSACGLRHFYLPLWNFTYETIAVLDIEIFPHPPDTVIPLQHINVLPLSVDSQQEAILHFYIVRNCPPGTYQGEVNIIYSSSSLAVPYQIEIAEWQDPPLWELSEKFFFYHNGQFYDAYGHLCPYLWILSLSLQPLNLTCQAKGLDAKQNLVHYSPIYKLALDANGFHKIPLNDFSDFATLYEDISIQIQTTDLTPATNSTPKQAEGQVHIPVFDAPIECCACTSTRSGVWHQQR
jgi:hypothetical protein